MKLLTRIFKIFEVFLFPSWFPHWLVKRKMRRYLHGCNYELAKGVLINLFTGTVIKKELSLLLNKFADNPCFDTAFALIKFDPKFVVFFEDTRKGGVTEHLFREGALKFKKMNVIYTPGGLKIRLDPERVERVLASAKNQIDLTDAYLDVELWAGFPNALSSVCTILTAVMTLSLTWTLVAFVLSFGAANVFQQFTYSRILNLIFPTFLDRWIIALPASAAAGVYLYLSDALLVGLTLFAIVVANWLHFTDIMLFIFMPFRLTIRKLTGVNLGDVEIAFIRILSLQALRAGIQLDWKIYNRQET